jgi:hypothetical protein
VKIKKKTGEKASDLLLRMRGAKETRTPDPLLAKQVLFQLSYSPWLQASDLLFLRLRDAGSVQPVHQVVLHPRSPCRPRRLSHGCFPPGI